MPVTTPIAAVAEQLSAVTYNADGLVPAIVQEHGTGEVLMMAWMNEETLRETLESGRTVFWSRSRQQRWRKGDSSGERQWVRAAYYDCDGDTLLFVVEQEGSGRLPHRQPQLLSTAGSEPERTRAPRGPVKAPVADRGVERRRARRWYARAGTSSSPWPGTGASSRCGASCWPT